MSIMTYPRKIRTYAMFIVVNRLRYIRLDTFEAAISVYHAFEMTHDSVILYYDKNQKAWFEMKPMRVA